MPAGTAERAPAREAGGILRRNHPLLLAFLLALLPSAARAQDGERLPDLTPQAFEIRGELQVSLPDLERQPLRGFAPPPRTYVVSADREPYVGPYAQRVEDLPVEALPPPEPPSVARAVSRTGLLEAAAGRYLGRHGRFALSAAGFGLDTEYAGYSGFEPSDRLADFAADDVRGRIGYTGGEAVRYGFALDGAYHGYGLYGAYNPFAFVAPSMGFTLPTPSPRARAVRTLGAEGSVEAAPSARTPFAVRARFETTGVEDDLGGDEEESGSLNDLIPPETRDQTESRITLRGEVEPGPFRLDASGAFGGLGDEGIGESVTGYSLGGAADLTLGGAQLTVGTRLLGYSASPRNGGGSSTLVAPIIEAEAPLSPTVRLYGWNRPRAHHRSLADLFRENPYAVAEPLLAPDLDVVNAEAGVEVQAEAVRLRFYGGGRYSPVGLYFQRWDVEAGACLPPLVITSLGESTCGETGFAYGLYRADYDAVAVLRGGADLTLYGPGGISLSLGGEVRRGRLPDQDRALPFFAPLAGRLSLAVPFARERGLVQATGTFEGARPTELDRQDDAPAWGDLRVEVGYRFAGRFGLLVRADHLAGRAERWPGFPQPPAVLTAGVRAGW